MALNEIDRSLATGGVQASTSFAISGDDQAHIMRILRDQLYSDRVLAVLREYSANAWDSHRMSGKADVPIKVTLPTSADPALRIRDFGAGLSHEDAFRVYTQYGKSTKRKDANAVGMLGIGSKSAFSYADTFVITSHHAGRRNVYVAVLDESDVGQMNLVDSSPTDETGIEIKIAVRPTDAWEFEAKAKELFRYFSPLPEINVTLPAPPARRIELTSGTITHVDMLGENTGGNWIAIMGCVPYVIRLDQLELCETHQCLRKMNGTMPFAINALDISASREELKYSAKTKAALVDRFTALVDDYMLDALEKLSAGSQTLFQQRLELRQLHTLGFQVPSEWESLSKSTVRVFDDADKAALYFVRDGAVGNTVAVTSDLMIVIDDTGKNLKGYDFAQSEYVVRRAHRRTHVPLSPAELAVVRADLDTHLAACSLTGAPIVLLSQRPFYDHRIKRKRQPGDPMSPSSLKRKVRVFEFNGGTERRRPSDNWDPIEDYEPTDEDPFVIIEAYKTYDNFERECNRDRQLATTLGVEFPVVLGYKSTGAKPVSRKDCVGVSYSDWRLRFYKTLDTPENRERIETMQWAELFGYYYLPDSKQLARLVKRLGSEHCIVTLVQRCRDAWESTRHDEREALKRLASELGLTGKSKAKEAYEALRDRYVLFQTQNDFSGISFLWSGDSDNEKAVTRRKIKAWLQYVKLVDAELDEIPNIFDDVKPALALVP